MKSEIAQIPFNWEMDKLQYNIQWYNIQQEWENEEWGMLQLICINIKEPTEHYTKWSKPQSKGYIIYDFIYNILA